MHLPWRDVAPSAGMPAISTSLLGEEIAELGRLAKGRRVLEFGSAYGYSAISMALAGAEHVDAYDPHVWMAGSYQAMAANVDIYGVGDLVSIHQLPSAAASGGPYGLVFIDGDHTEPGVAADIGVAQRLVAPGGYIACHDYDECCCPGVRTAVDQLLPRGALTGTLWVVKVPA